MQKNEYFSSSRKIPSLPFGAWWYSCFIYFLKSFISSISILLNLRMSLVSLPSTIFSCKIIPKPFSFKAGPKASYNNYYPLNPKLIRVNGDDSYSPLSFNNTLVQRRLSSKRKKRGLSLLPFSGENGESGEEEEECRAMDTVLRLHKAIKNKNLQELSEIIADECRCVCNFVSFYRLFHGKKQVLEFFSYLMKSLDKNIEFVVQPTLHDGMNIGISWRLEWKETQIPLVKGFSFYTCHVYQGKLVIRNMEMVMEPLLHIEPIRLVSKKFVDYVMNALGKMGSKRAVRILLILFFMDAWLFLSL